MAEVFILKGERGILAQPGKGGTVVTFHSDHNQFRVGGVQIGSHSPALAIGGVPVKENVVAVEHIQHGKPGGRVLSGLSGKIDVHIARLFPGNRPDRSTPFFNHYITFFSKFGKLPLKGGSL